MQMKLEGETWFKDAAVAVESQRQAVNVFQQTSSYEFFLNERKAMGTIGTLKW